MDRALAQAAIDEAFKFHMRELFGAMARHVGQNSSDLSGARDTFRKAFSNARQAHREMSDHATEVFGG